MEEPLLEVRDLRLEFQTQAGRLQALDGVSLTISRGEIVGLVGESGSGKTATARAILGVLPVPPAVISGGTIRLDGENLLALSDDEMTRRIRGKRITLIPQVPLGSLNPLLMVGTQMRDVLRWNGPARARQAARRELDDEIVEGLRSVQLPNPRAQLRKYPHEFSGGQRQRLLIAMALAPRPGLVIADEATTALDATIQAQILRLLRNLVKDRGVSVLFTTHDLGTAHEICDRVVVMYAGQEMEAAPTGAFFSRPAHPYTRRLLDSLPSPESDLQDIPGEVPSLIDPPSGCRFHPRCPKAQFPKCKEDDPVLERQNTGQLAACHFPLEDPIIVAPGE
jgi:peptide/nickel transport system ATP-binding protein